jgi:hypothetical protein
LCRFVDRGGLVGKGTTQNNCIWSHAKQVRRRKIDLDRLLEPERATFSVVKGAGGDWRIGELKARSNPPATIEPGLLF